MSGVIVRSAALRFSTVRNKRDNKPKTHEADFGAFVEFIRGNGNVIALPREEFTALPEGERKKLKNGPAVILAAFDGAGRKMENVVAVTGATFDLDSGNPAIEAVVAAVDGLTALVHESASSSPQERKLRLFIPYAVPVDIATHHAAWVALAARLDPRWLGGRTLGHDVNRLCYLPPSFAGDECGEFMVLEGQPFDATSAPCHEAPVKPNGKSLPEVLNGLDRLKGRVNLEAELTKVATGAVYHDALRDSAASMAAKGCTFEQIDAVCRATLTANKPADAPTLERWQREWDDLDRTIRSALERYAPKPGADPDRVARLTALLNERGKLLDLAIFKERPAGPRFVWGGYMSRGTVTILSAIGGLGKSQVGIAHGIRAACGVGFLEAPTTGGERVWYVSLEDSPDAVHLRIHAAARALVQEDFDAPKYKRSLGEAKLLAMAQERFRYVDLYGAEFRVAMKVHGELMPTPDLDLLAEYIESQGGADVVYVDTLIRSHSADENANDQMARVLVGYEGFARRLEAGVGLLVHVPKSKGDDRTSHAARGAGAITDNARSAINITAATLEDVKGFSNVMPEWINPENPRLLRITHGKSNYAGRERPRWALLREGWVEEFTPVESHAAIEERRYTALQAWWRDERGYKSRPLSKSAIEARLESIKEHSGQPKVGKRQWQAALAWAIDEGHAVTVIEAVGDNPDSKFYRLNPVTQVAGVPSSEEGAE